jgi:large subunit ribosomal protein L28
VPVWLALARLATLGRLPECSTTEHDLSEEAIVASHCDVCGKGPGFGMSVSHSHRRTSRRWNPNVQTVRALVAPGTRRRVSVCTSCLKAGKVTRG